MSNRERPDNTPLTVELLRNWVFFDPNSGCWLWERSTDTQGYGLAWDNGKHITAHRASWTVHKGAIPAGAHVLHKCDTRSCINPDHLFLGDHAANMADKKAKGRAPSTGAEKNGMAKLTNADAIKIFADKRRLSEIAKEYGVTETTISYIRNGKTWWRATGARGAA